MNFYNLNFEKVIEELNSDSQKGLSLNEASKRLVKFGLNKLEEKEKINPFFLFLSQFKSFIIYILIFAVIVSIISNEMTEAIVILIILIFNAIFGFVQEYRAEKSIEALKKFSALTTKVIRDGAIKVIDVKKLVPGDIILLEEGDKIPADCRIITETLLQTSESALTGESTSVSKDAGAIKGELSVADQKNMLFSGTIVAKGKAKAIVVKTGMSTQIGKIATMISTAGDEMTPLQKKLEKFGKVVGVIVICISILVFLVGIIKNGQISLLMAGEFSRFIIASREWFLVAISLAVAAVPEGLPAIVTIALAIGVKKMVKQNSLIRKLPSVETLGETTIICTDKTGTLTKNQMTVKKAWTFDLESDVEGLGYNPHGSVSKKINKILFRAGHLCNDSTLVKKHGVWNITGDPTEGALVVSSKKYGFDYENDRKNWVRVDEIPFDSDRKLMSTVNENKKTKEKLVFVKGAPEFVLEKCNRVLINGKIVQLTSKHKKEIFSKNDEYGNSALRVLGFAYKKFDSKSKSYESDLIFIGLQAMLDPPHKEVAGSIKKCHDAGIRVIMITGDNRHTAKGIASKIGIEGDSIDGKDFEKLTDLQKIKALKTTNIFARVEPSHKMEIVRILQNQGNVVAMTGDGVNDAPAIKKADIGIAMGINGTDVSKESSEMILLDDKFTSIVSAIEEGRGIYENIKKFINYLFSSNLAEVMIILFAISLGLPLPMTAIMLLWLNLVTDGLPALALSVDPNSSDLMEKKPSRSNEQIMDNKMIFNVVYVAILITVAILSIMNWSLSVYTDVAKAQTLAFTGIIVMELVRLQAIRSEYHLGMFSNIYLVWAVIFSLFLQMLVVYSPLGQFFGTVPLNFTDWTIIIFATFVVFVFNIIGQKMRKKFEWFNG